MSHAPLHTVRRMISARWRTNSPVPSVDLFQGRTRQPHPRRRVGLNPHLPVRQIRAAIYQDLALTYYHHRPHTDIGSNSPLDRVPVSAMSAMSAPRDQDVIGEALDAFRICSGQHPREPHLANDPNLTAARPDRPAL